MIELAPETSAEEAAAVSVPERPTFPPNSFRNLVGARIAETATALQRRIAQRFPGSGLSQLAYEVEKVARESVGLSSWLARPHWFVRGISASLCRLRAHKRA